MAISGKATSDVEDLLFQILRPETTASLQVRPSSPIARVHGLTRCVTAYGGSSESLQVPLVTETRRVQAGSVEAIPPRDRIQERAGGRRGRGEAGGGGCRGVLAIEILLAWSVLSCSVVDRKGEMGGL